MSDYKRVRTHDFKRVTEPLQHQSDPELYKILELGSVEEIRLSLLRYPKILYGKMEVLLILDRIKELSRDTFRGECSYIN